MHHLCDSLRCELERPRPVTRYARVPRNRLAVPAVGGVTGARRPRRARVTPLLRAAHTRQRCVRTSDAAAGWCVGTGPGRDARRVQRGRCDAILLARGAGIRTDLLCTAGTVQPGTAHPSAAHRRPVHAYTAASTAQLHRMQACTRGALRGSAAHLRERSESATQSCHLSDLSSENPMDRSPKSRAPTARRHARFARAP